MGTRVCLVAPFTYMCGRPTPHHAKPKPKPPKTHRMVPSPPAESSAGGSLVAISTKTEMGRVCAASAATGTKRFVAGSNCQERTVPSSPAVGGGMGWGGGLYRCIYTYLYTRVLCWIGRVWFGCWVWGVWGLCVPVKTWGMTPPPEGSGISHATQAFTCDVGVMKTGLKDANAMCPLHNTHISHTHNEPPPKRSTITNSHEQQIYIHTYLDCVGVGAVLRDHQVHALVVGEDLAPPHQRRGVRQPWGGGGVQMGDRRVVC